MLQWTIQTIIIGDLDAFYLYIYVNCKEIIIIR